MKPFTYQAPATIEAAVALLAQGGQRARPLAGGTDLLVQLRRGALDLGLLVDVKRIPELNRISFDPGAGLTVGAAVSCARLRAHGDTVQRYPGLIDAISVIGGSAVQERATVGGNLCNAAPSGDSIPAMIVLAATCALAGPAGRRTVPVEQFCLAPGQTVLQPGEIVVSILFPPPSCGEGAAYCRFTPRREMDIAVAGAGAWVALRGGKIEAARIALGAVAPRPLPVPAAAEALTGAAPSEGAFAAATACAQDAADPITDVRGTAAQRRHLVGVLVKRALRTAVARARGEECDD